jgi:hypothetical protein
MSSIAGMNKGDDLYFKRGTICTGGLNVAWGGIDANNRSIIGAYGAGDRPIIDGLGNSNTIDLNSNNYILIEHLNIRNSTDSNVRIRNSNQYIVIDDCLIEGAKNAHGITLVGIHFILKNSILYNNGSSGSDHGIYIDTTGTADDIVVENCEIYSNHGSGIKINSGNVARIKNIVVRYCKIYDNGNHGIDDYAADGAKYYYNLIYGNGITYGGNGIYMASNAGTYHARNNEIYNNVISHKIANYACIKAASGSTGHKIKNNILFALATAYYLETQGTGSFTGSDYNDFYGGTVKWIHQGVTQSTLTGWRQITGFDIHSIISNPLFINAGSYDYNIQSYSPCINAGTPVGLIRDYLGVSVPQRFTPNIGAFEYSNKSSLNPPQNLRLTPN